ncbi:MAG: methyltransferase [Candidatus Kapabacteria bacterium]|nr:methyltransferase [Candidatus Kapabacteria bacterium]
MPNPYFQFKQFLVRHDMCGQKVSTDACIFGAWAARSMALRGDLPKYLMDIGTGSGLLALMAAQYNPTLRIDAIELDMQAAEQAAMNVKASPWSDAIRILHGTVQDYARNEGQGQYDIVVSNPPFFAATTTPGDAKRRNASHTVTLGFSELVESVNRLLASHGRFFVLLPMQSSDEFMKYAADKGLYPCLVLRIRDSVRRTPHRCCIEFIRCRTVTITSSLLTIKEPDNSYTAEFVDLLSAFYLHL